MYIPSKIMFNLNFFYFLYEIKCAVYVLVVNRPSWWPRDVVAHGEYISMGAESPQEGFRTHFHCGVIVLEWRLMWRTLCLYMQSQSLKVLCAVHDFIHGVISNSYYIWFNISHTIPPEQYFTLTKLCCKRRGTRVSRGCRGVVQERGGETWGQTGDTLGQGRGTNLVSQRQGERSSFLKDA